MIIIIIAALLFCIFCCAETVICYTCEFSLAVCSVWVLKGFTISVSLTRAGKTRGLHSNKLGKSYTPCKIASIFRVSSRCHPCLFVCWGYWWGLLLKSHSQFSNGYSLSHGQPLFVFVFLSLWQLSNLIFYVFVKGAGGYLCDWSVIWKHFPANLKTETICVRTLFSVAHTEHASPQAKAHKQRPKNTHCTFSHIQTEKHTTRHSPFFFTASFHQACDSQRSQDNIGTFLLIAEPLVIVYT